TYSYFDTIKNYILFVIYNPANLFSRYIEPPVLLCFGDSKTQIREAAVTALSSWQARVPIASIFENDMIADALKNVLSNSNKSISTSNCHQHSYTRTNSEKYRY
ncbi:cytoskeleton-associated protein 5, partial [Schistosoma japonicum]